MCVNACLHMSVWVSSSSRQFCSADPLIQRQPRDALWLKRPNSVHAVSAGLGRAVLCRARSPSPRSLKSAAAPPAPREAVAGHPPTPGSRAAALSIPPAGGKGEATLPRCTDQRCADWACCHLSEKLVFNLIWPLPRQSRSWQWSCVAGSLL